MNLKKNKIEKYKILPDKHGASYDEIEEFKPKNFVKLENYIRSFMDINNEDIHAKGLIATCMLVAPWGIGKTTTYDVLIKNMIQEDNYEGFSIKITAEELSEAYNNYKDKPEFKAKSKIGDRFLFLLTKLLFEDPEFIKTFPDLVSTHSNDIVEYVSNVLKTIQERYKFFLIFIDELEEVIKSPNNIIPFILKSVKHLLNGRSNIINHSTNPELINLFSLILACTDAAIYEIARLEELEYQYGGINRRIHEEHILKITLEEAIEYLMKLNKYSYKGKNIKSFTNPGASFNTIARMAMMNPGYMKSFFAELMSGASDRNGNSMQQIDGEFLLENSRSFYLEYLDVKRLPINKVVYDNWFSKFRSDEILSKLLYLFIGEIKPFSLKELSERFKDNVSPTDILIRIEKFNEYIRSIHQNIKNAIIPVYFFNENITSADIQNLLIINSFQIEEDNETLINTIRFPEVDISLNQFMESISFFESEPNSTIIQKFFSADKEILKEILSYLNNASVTILKMAFEKQIDKTKEFYIINPNLFDIIFPVPIPTDYNLLKDKNENIRIWNDIRRTKNREIYRKMICSIMVKFLSLEDESLDFQMKKTRNETEILELNNFSFYNDVLDKNKFIILKSVEIKELSNNSINIMIWREIGDYDKVVVNEITLRIDDFQRNERANIHLLFLISQNKIPEDYLIDLSKKLEYSIVKEISLKQLEVIKYTFLHKIYEKFESKEYNYRKFLDTLNKLISPLKEIIDACKVTIEDKGLDIKLNKYASTLSDIPQLMKYIHYDFKSDYTSWKNVELHKPFEYINPIGLSTRYGSSLDDYSPETLRKMVEEYLLENNFVVLNKGAMKISMPKIQNKIFELIKNYAVDGIYLSLNELNSFFVNTSSNPTLLNTVFLTDLGNRGLIHLKKQKGDKVQRAFLLDINETDLENKLADLNLKLKNLLIKDLDFYHIFTIKQRGYNLIYLKYFIEELERIIKISSNIEFNKYFNNTKRNLFSRIHKIIDGIVDKIFIPLSVNISALRKNLSYAKDDKYLTSSINSKLEEFGLKNFNIENLSEIRDSEKKYKNIFSKMDSPVNRVELDKIAKKYYTKHRNNTDSREVVFSHKILKENKLKKEFSQPFLNLIYYQIEEEKKEYLSAPIFEKIEKINKLINKVDGNYKELKGYLSQGGNYSGELASTIYEKVKSYSNADFETEIDSIKSLSEIQQFLDSLKKKINGIQVPISRIISRKGKRNQLSLLDKIDREESLFIDNTAKTKEFMSYLKTKEIIKNDSKIEEISDSINFKELILKINECKNLEDIVEAANGISFTLENKISSTDNSINSIINHIVKYFRELFNINYLKKRFSTFKKNIYVKQCNSYENNIRRLLDPNQKVNLKDICNQIIHFKEKIIQGQNELLKDNVSEDAQKFFIELQEKYGEQKWFNKKDIEDIKIYLKITQQKAEKLIEELKEKELIEESFRFN